MFYYPFYPINLTYISNHIILDIISNRLYFNIQSILSATINSKLRTITKLITNKNNVFSFYGILLLLSNTVTADINVNGSITGGINYNPANPPQGNNGPVSMTDQSGAMNLYQLNLSIEKALSKKNIWEIGGRIDYMFGTDSRYTQATGHWDMNILDKNNYYNIAIPQAYTEIYAPLATGISAKIGHFYTIIGYESVPSSLNFFSSHTYSFKSSPFTTTGTLFNYAINDEWSINTGAVTGADNFDRDFGAWSEMSSVTWTHPQTGTTASFSILSGDVYLKQRSQLIYYSAILQQTLGAIHYVIQHDLGSQQNVLSENQTANWYSIVQYLDYQVTANCGVGLRGEIFNDKDGVRYANGPATYYAITSGLNWKPKSWLMIRPEFRYDWSTAHISVFNDNHATNQFLIGADAIISYNLL